MTSDALLGEQVFRTQNCAACHSGINFTDSALGISHNIGTLRPGSGQRLGAPLAGLDAPSLRGVWATAPYLHNGGAATLGDAVSAHSGLSISATDLARLVAYLQQIDDAPASAPTAPAGGFLTLLADDFNDNTRDASKWTLGALFAQIDSGAAAFDSAISVLEQNGRIEIQPRVNTAGDHYSGYLSAASYDFSNSTAAIGVVQTANGDSDTYLAVSKDARNFLAMIVEGGVLYTDRVANGERHVSSHAYSSTQARYWRIRHSLPNTVSYDISADAVTWQTLRSEAIGFDATNVRVEFGAGTAIKMTSPGLAIFDNFTLTRSGSGPVNQAPVARLGGPYSGVRGSAVSFNGNASTDSDGSITGYAWSFGDGGTANGVAPSYTYSAAGTYTVTLTVSDNGGATHSASTTAVISSPVNVPPVALPGGPYNALRGSVFTLSGSNSSDSDGTITSYAWLFGDGTSGTGATTSKTYAATGIYTITLTVTDNSGATNSATTTATITAPANTPPIARPTGPYNGISGTPVVFNGSTSTDADGTISAYAWSFGDGGTASGATPSHTYTAAASYTVTLTVTDNTGATNSASTTASITAPGNQTPTARAGGPYSANVGQTFTLNGSASSDTDGAISSYEWRMGDTARESAVLTDNFNDNIRETAKWNISTILGTINMGAVGYDPGVAVAERNQRVEITLRPNLSGDRYAGYVTASTFDFTGASVSAEVVQASSGDSNTLLSVSKDSQNMALMVTESGALFCAQILNGQADYVAVNYNPALHRFWRIRHTVTTQANFVFEASPDAIAWQTLHTARIQFALTSARAEISAGTWKTEPSPGTAVFDNFRIARATNTAETVLGGATPLHSYTIPGIYTVRLKVTDNGGLTNEATTTVTIGAGGSTPSSTSLGSAVLHGPQSLGGTIFNPAPLSALRGNWVAVAEGEASGLLSIKVAAKGAFTGQLRLRDSKLTLTGRLAYDGTAAVILTTKSAAKMRVQLQLDPLGRRMRAVLHGGESPLEFDGIRAVTSLNPKFCGSFNTLLTSETEHGYACIKVSANGSVQLIGKLADSRVFAATAPISEDGKCPVFIPLHANRGEVSGWLQSNSTNLDIAIKAKWFRKEMPDEALDGGGEHYTPSQPDSFTALTLAPAGDPMTTLHGTLMGSVFKASGVQLSIVRKTGEVTGRYEDASNQTRYISGVILQGSRCVKGIISGPTGTGTFELQ